MTAGSDRVRGQTAFQAGHAAEDCVARDYENRGYDMTRRRWRGSTGEIDLVARDGDGFVFVEVKKSRSFARAAERLMPRQMQRIMAAAEEFLMREGLSLMTPMRFDLAVVNAAGETRIMENAFGDF
jgi:Predicted endonuclease distantly related to archaeal Holliday junction resolvase